MTLQADVLAFLHQVAGMVLPKDDGTHTRDDVREKKQAAQALIRRYTGKK